MVRRRTRGGKGLRAPPTAKSRSGDGFGACRGGPLSPALSPAPRGKGSMLARTSIVARSACSANPARGAQSAQRTSCRFSPGFSTRGNEAGTRRIASTTFGSVAPRRAPSTTKPRSGDGFGACRGDPLSPALSPAPRGKGSTLARTSIVARSACSADPARGAQSAQRTSCRFSPGLSTAGNEAGFAPHAPGAIPPASGLSPIAGNAGRVPSPAVRTARRDSGARARTRG